MENPSFAPPVPAVPMSGAPPAPEAPAAAPAAPRYPRFGGLFKRAIEIWKVQWWRLALLGFLPNLLGLVIAGFAIGAAALIGSLASFGAMLFALIPVALAALVLVVWLGARIGAMSIQISLGADQRVGLREAWRSTKGMAWSLCLVGFLTSLVVFGGMMMLIVPAIIWSASFVFAPYALVRDGVKGRAALVRARQLVKGNLFDIIISVFVFGLCMILLNIPLGIAQAAFKTGSAGRAVVGLLGWLFNLLVLSPLILGYVSAIFEWLHANKSDNLPEMPRAKLVYTIAAALGLLWPFLIILPLFAASNLMRSAQMSAALKREAATQAIVEPDAGQLESGGQPAGVATGGASDDSDGDGIIDRQETANGDSDPRNPDTDGDGLGDGDEYTLSTSANAADSDGDGYDDGDEILNGFDPTAANQPLSEETRAMIIDRHAQGLLHEPTITTLRPLLQ